MSKLIWPPAINKIREIASNGSRLNACVSAFAKFDAVKVLSEFFDPEHCYVITRWRVPELASGVSDVEIYPFLRDMGVPLYISFNLHSKLFRFTNDSVLCGSCNATANGLGLSDHPNIETACIVPGLGIGDEIEFKKLAESSVRVDDDIYYEFRNAVEECPPAPPFETHEIEIYDRHLRGKEFLLSNLPTTKSPELLIKAMIRDPMLENLSTSQKADCVNFALRPSWNAESVESALSQHFRDSPFVVAIADEIRTRGSMRFGEMTSFVHTQCRDVPLPCRYDIKERVNTLYSWLCYFFDDLSWDRPGARSQVIRSSCKRWPTSRGRRNGS